MPVLLLGGIPAAIVIGVVLVPAMYLLPQKPRARLKGEGAAGRKMAVAAAEDTRAAAEAPAADD